ncbi:hypothetical protein CASFOL_027996 [Castilleja foliolosa]|uniref:Uncharacterized protein n=1 Tax=Castilleja foliolosa TaxID=1961234 RepID=A0ABD3CGD1_9LAMI
MAKIEARQRALANLTDHKGQKPEIAKKNFTTTLDIIKGKIDKNQINKGNKHKLCECCRLMLVEDSEEDSSESSKEDSDEGKALVWPDWPEFGLGSTYYKMVEELAATDFDDEKFS